MEDCRLRNSKERKGEEKGGEWGRRSGKSQTGALSILGERRAHPPALALAPQLPVPGPGGFGQLTQPPGETHTDTHHGESQVERDTTRWAKRDQQKPDTEDGQERDRRGWRLVTSQVWAPVYNV